MKCNAHIPRKADSCFCEKEKFTSGVIVTDRSKDRVRGYFKGDKEHTFDVKHDGERFAIGGGSGKFTFWFKNEGKRVSRDAY